MIKVSQVVRRVGEEREAAVCCGPLCGRVDGREVLRRDGGALSTDFKVTVTGVAIAPVTWRVLCRGAGPGLPERRPRRS